MWHAPLGVRNAKRRHQSPEWTILSHSYRLIQEEIVRPRVLLDSLHPCSLRTSWSSPLVLRRGSSYDTPGICLVWHSWDYRWTSLLPVDMCESLQSLCLGTWALTSMSQMSELLVLVIFDKMVKYTGHTMSVLLQHSYRLLWHLGLTTVSQYCMAESPRVTTDKLQRVMSSTDCTVTNTRKFNRGLSQPMHGKHHWLHVID